MSQEIVPAGQETPQFSALKLLGVAKAFAEEGLWKDLLGDEFGPLREAYPTRYGFLLLSGIRKELEDARAASGMLNTDVESVGLLGELEESLLGAAKKVVKEFFPDQDPDDDPSSLLLKDVAKFRLKEALDDLDFWKDLKSRLQKPMNDENDGLDGRRAEVEKNLQLAHDAVAKFNGENY